MRRTLSSAAIAAFVMFVNVSAALAQGTGGGSGGSSCSGNHDPGKIGECAKGIVSSNAKAIWWILLVVGVLSMIASRKAGRAVATGVLLVVSGIAIYNPAGVGSMMSNL